MERNEGGRPPHFFIETRGPGLYAKIHVMVISGKAGKSYGKNRLFSQKFPCTHTRGAPGAPLFKRVNLFSSLIYILISIHYFNYIFSEKNNYLI